ncbi:MAG: hypothetical protein ACLFUT_10685 [Desulfobacteraceae bacterium]
MTTLRLEVNENMMKHLLTTGQVCAADFRCLDGESKQSLWRLCLESCALKGTGDLRKRPEGPVHYE